MKKNLPSMTVDQLRAALRAVYGRFGGGAPAGASDEKSRPHVAITDRCDDGPLAGPDHG
jgi:hypothetical protein